MKRTMPLSRIITLNVGGTLFTVARSTLAQAPAGLLQSIARDEFAGGDDDNGRPFICRDGAAFPAILTFLRTGVAWVPPDKGVPLQAIRGEFDFYFADPPPVFRAEHLDVLAHPVVQLMQPFRGLVDEMRAGLWNWIDKRMAGDPAARPLPGEGSDDAYTPVHIGRGDFVAPCIPSYEAYDAAFANDIRLQHCLGLDAYVHTRTRISIEFVYLSGARIGHGDQNAHAVPAGGLRAFKYDVVIECLQTLFAADRVDMDTSNSSCGKFTLIWYSAKHV